MTEFSRPVRLDRLSSDPTELRIEATPAERAALASRFGLVEVAALSADLRLVRSGEIVRAEGALDGAVTQSCVATGEPVPAVVRTPFSLAFYPETMDAQAEERELSEAELDTLFYQGDSVDIGEASAETLALALDPWPRAPNADDALRAAGVKREEEVGAFSALAALKAKLDERG